MVEKSRDTAIIGNLVGAHYTSLDGLRGLAILLVMCYHFGLAYDDIHSTAALMQVAQFGWLGVDLFFVLSGFLITGILMETKTSEHYLRNFLMRRFLRIWPLYYVSLAMFFVVAPLVVHPLPEQLVVMGDKQAWFWLYAANWLFASEGGFEGTSGGYYWSLAVEEQFYLIWPFIVYRFSNSSLLKLCTWLFVGGFLLRVWMWWWEGWGWGDFGPTVVYTMTFTHMDGLLVGSALAVCLRSEALSQRLVRCLPYVAIGAFLTLVLVRLGDKSGFFWEANMSKYGYSAAAILFGTLLVWVLGAPPQSLVGRLFANTFLRLIGKYSYALYLLHVPVAVGMERLLLHRFQDAVGDAFGYALFIVATFATCVALAAMSWYFFERHILGLKKHFKY